MWSAGKDSGTVCKVVRILVMVNPTNQLILIKTLLIKIGQKSILTLAAIPIKPQFHFLHFLTVSSVKIQLLNQSCLLITISINKKASINSALTHWLQKGVLLLNRSSSVRCLTCSWFCWLVWYCCHNNGVNQWSRKNCVLSLLNWFLSRWTNQLLFRIFLQRKKEPSNISWLLLLLLAMNGKHLLHCDVTNRLWI